MKMRCECGEVISDQTDNLPYKAHLFPDQDWFKILDGIDKILEDLDAKRLTEEEASHGIRRLHISGSRLMWQCSSCGRLLVSDKKGQTNIYAPTSAKESKRILEGEGPAR